ncbi:hypothetical protein EW146_g1990 [Bondarzewia mesenterica]|uniref:Transmembrane protein n=1 Tax=Bondarzewia mesenterica TaxID=1095465 RepID=A0A4S4M275_9AGAM|nr:hypothetical protein EW146_g1990 [Bondarzewia mesenterica]
MRVALAGGNLWKTSSVAFCFLILTIIWCFQSAMTTRATQALLHLRPPPAPSHSGAFPSTYRSPTLSSLIWSLSSPSYASASSAHSNPHNGFSSPSRSMSTSSSSRRLSPSGLSRVAVSHRAAFFTPAHVRSMAAMRSSEVEDDISEEEAMKRLQISDVRYALLPFVCFVDIFLAIMSTFTALYLLVIHVLTMAFSKKDVHIPVSPFRRKGLSIKERASHLGQNFLNTMKNATSMYQLAKTDFFPNTYIKSPRTWAVFKTRSTKDDAWVAPLRAEFLDTYGKVNGAVAKYVLPPSSSPPLHHSLFSLSFVRIESVLIARSVPRGDLKTIKSLTMDNYAQTLKNRLLAFHPQTKKGSVSPTFTYKWRYSLNAPVEIVSIRATQGHWGLQEPRTGSRLYAQALVRFDTKQVGHFLFIEIPHRADKMNKPMQTLRVYNSAGKLVKEKSQIAPKPVVEYLVFEKRMWYDLPWAIRERLYEDL